MNIRKKMMIKRACLKMDIDSFANVCKVDANVVKLFEQGTRIEKDLVETMFRNVEKYIRSFDRKDYLLFRIKEETMTYEHESEEEHAYTLSHMAIHVTKLNMEFVGK